MPMFLYADNELIVLIWICRVFVFDTVSVRLRKCDVSSHPSLRRGGERSCGDCSKD